MDRDARWCKTCTLLDDVEPDAYEETCRDCQDSDQNKDVVVEDLYFMRIFQGVQLKQAGVPVMELVTTLDDVLAIHAVEQEIERIAYEQAKEDADPGTTREDDLLEIE